MIIWKEGRMRIGIKNPQEIKLMRESGRILGIILAELEKMIAPGITGIDLDLKAAAMMKEFGVNSSFKGYHGYPAVTCVNINEQVVHCIPTATPLKSGDIITVDCGVIYEGFHSDSAIQKGVGEIKPEVKKFLETAEKALNKGIQTARPGIRIQVVSAAIEDVLKKNGYGIVRELIGHGIGTKMHEDPPVPNYRDTDPGPILQEGMTIAIEPIVTMGSNKIKTLKDGWTVVTLDNSLATQVEHTIAITKNGSEILTKRPALKI